MNKKLLYVLSFILLSGSVYSQQGDGGAPLYNGSKSTIDSRNFSTPNVNALQAEDAIVDADKSGPWRFGYNNETNLNFSNSGTWVNLPNGGKIWQLVVNCENALTVNLTFEDLSIPAGNEMYVFNPSKSFILGKFTQKHVYEGQLGTELVPGSTVIVEYYVAPENVNVAKSLKIAKVTHGYRTAGEFQEKAFGSSGSCNMNSICPDGDPIRDPIRSTIMLVSGSNGFCTGAMINNTANDGTPYVLTANHCYSNPASWIFRFHWASSTCSNPGSSPSDFESLSGATLRSRRTASDFCLVEITGGLVNNTVPESFNTYFSGWNKANTAATSATCVHHPSGDIKKISFDDNPLSQGNGMGSTENNSQWVLVWDRNTTTEPGSSGSPLFDQNNRIIGQLWGGGASCSNLSSPDYYGKLSSSWDPSGSNSSNHLVTWLDPTGSGVVTLDGYDPITYCNSTYTNSSTSEMCFGDATGTLDVSFVTGVTAGATFDIGNGPQATGAFTGLTQGSYSVVVIDGEACATTVNVTVSGPAVLSAGAGLAAEVTPFTGSINLNVSGGTPGYTFAWTGPNGFTAATEDISGLEGGSYAITITDVNGCTFSSSYTVNSFVGIDELSADMVNVYPNPTKGTINIAVHSGLSGTFNAKVLDLSGRVIMNNTIESNSVLTMDLSNKSNGTYILELSNDNTRLTKRIVLKK